MIFAMKTFSTTQDLRQALSEHMLSQGLTQLNVAKATGIPQSAISLFLRGKRGLSGDSVLSLIRVISEEPELTKDISG